MSENFSDKNSDSLKSAQIRSFYEFASFRVDVKKRRLMRGDEIVSLTPKEFDVLFFLLENGGRVVEKDEILEKVWKDTFVEEATLTRNISWLRKKLAANGAENEKIIETLPKRGYRFLPEIISSENALIIEEQTIQHIQIEEIIEIDSETDDSALIAANQFGSRLSLPEKRARIQLSAFQILLLLALTATLATLVYRVFFRENQTKVIMATKIAPFSGLPGRENSPAFSPDGKQMVFAWDGGVENGDSDIYVKFIGDGEPVALTNTETEEIAPVFSPDGKSVAFVRVFADHNEIIIISALGGAERKIYEHASYASVSFSPDGSHLAAAELDLSGNQAGLFTINLQNGEKTRLTTPTAPAVDHTPRFSPDGKNIAFIRYFSSFRREIFVVPAAGGEPRQITADDVRIYGLAWHTNSKNLFFTSFRDGNQINLWQISINDDREPQLIPTGSRDLQSVAISPNGRTLAFVEQSVDENIWEIETGDGKKPPRPLIRSSRADHSQQFSPDGSQIVFASDRTGNYEIWFADADGKKQRQLTDSGGSAGSPRFSPNGKLVVYDAQIAGGSDIYIVSASGGAPRRLTANGKNNSLPAWSADGRWIFFVSNASGSNQIWKIPETGGEAVQVTRQGASEMFAVPNGNQLIYSKGGGKAGLWTVSQNGGDEQPIVELAEAGIWRSWFVDAKGVYYTAFSTQPPFRVKFFDFATRQTRQISTIEKSPPAYYQNLTVSPDEKKMLYARQDQSASNIMLAELD